MPVRYFSVDEANAMLATLRPVVRDMLEARQRIVEARPQVWPVLEKAIGNGGNKPAGELIKEFDRIQRAVKHITSRGILVKDVNTGLLDFLTERDGREVYLCWRYDEPTVSHWHNLEAGFAGRQPL